MKKVILLLTLLATFSVNYASNDSFDNHKIIETKVENYTILTPDVLASDTCFQGAVLVFRAALREGYSVEDSANIADTWELVCDAITVLSNALGAEQ
ncbi:hypothetical protein [Polaribacter sp. M15]